MILYKKMDCYIFTLIIGLFSQSLFALDCPKMPVQVDSNWSAQVDAAVLKIGKVKGVELLTRARTTTTDLLGKLPDSNVVYLEQMMYSSYCSALREDKSISETEKGSLIRTYNKEVRNTINHKNSVPTSTSSVKKKSKHNENNADSTINKTSEELKSNSTEVNKIDSVAISGNNNKGTIIRNNTIVGFDVGVEDNNSTGTIVKENTFSVKKEAVTGNNSTDRLVEDNLLVKQK